MFSPAIQACLSMTEEPSGETTGSWSTAASGDDVGRNGTEDAWATDRVQIRLGIYGGQQGRSVIRFPAVTIPANSTVTAASITAKAYGAGSSSGNGFIVYGLEGDTEQSEIDTEAEVDSLTRTATSVAVAERDASAYTLGQEITLVPDSADFRAVVAEILATSWTLGYDMGFDLVGNGGGYSSILNIATYDQDSYTMTLSVTYAAP